MVAPRYKTGKPCKRGHISPRFVSTGACIQCAKERRALDPQRERDLANNRRKSNLEKHRAKDRINRAKNTERRRADWKKWNEKNKERIRIERADWRKANPDLASAKDRDSYLKYAEECREYARKYRRENKEKRLVVQNKRRARQLGADGTHTVDDVARIRAAQKDRCAYCPIPLKGKGHLDHIKPLSKGGSNWPRNLQLLCVPCNISKSNRDAIDFARSRGKIL